MNGKKAKRIRKEIYGEMSSKDTQYEEEFHSSLIKVKDKLKKVRTKTLASIGLRAEYLKAKKEAS